MKRLIFVYQDAANYVEVQGWVAQTKKPVKEHFQDLLQHRIDSYDILLWAKVKLLHCIHVEGSTTRIALNEKI